MAFKFERFANVRDKHKASVTVRQATGQIGFGVGALNKFGIRNYSHCVLYFDKTSSVVGIQFTNNSGEPGATGIYHCGANTYVKAKNFLDFFGVDYRKTISSPLKKDDSTGICYFHLGIGEGEKTE